MKRLYPLLFLFLTLSHGLSGVAKAQVASESNVAPAIVINADTALENLAPYVRYSFSEKPINDDSDREMILSDQSYRPLTSEAIDFGYTDKTIWLRFSVINHSNQTNSMILSTGLRFASAMRIYEVSENNFTTLLADSGRDPFSNRSLPTPILGLKINFQPQENKRFVIAYTSEAESGLPLKLINEADYYRELKKNNIVSAAIYSTILTMLFFTLLQWFFIRKITFLLYAMWIFCSGMYFFHMDGLGFQILWPDLPAWNRVAANTLGLGGSIFLVLFCRQFLSLRHNFPILNIALLLIAALALICILLTPWLTQLANKYGFSVASLTILACFMTAFAALIKGQYTARFYLVGLSGILVTAFLLSSAHYIFTEIPKFIVLYAAKFALLFETIMFGMALADQTTYNRKELLKARQSELELLQEHQQSLKALYAAEKEQINALSQAEDQSMHLSRASTNINSHLKQLRRIVSRLIASNQLSLAANNQIMQGLSFLDDIAENFTQASQQKYRTTGNDEVISNNHENEASFPIATLLSNLNTMFKDEAENKGLTFKVRSINARTISDMLIVLRILTNFIGNAIKYTHHGGILLACQRRQHELVVHVYDTGPGISDEDIQTIFNEYERAKMQHSNIDGQGLGLAIAAQLAAQAGYHLYVKSVVGKGSRFSLGLPLIDQTKLSRPEKTYAIDE